MSDIIMGESTTAGPATFNPQQETLLRALPDGDRALMKALMAIDQLQDETHRKSPLLKFPKLTHEAGLTVLMAMPYEVKSGLLQGNLLSTPGIEDLLPDQDRPPFPLPSHAERIAELESADRQRLSHCQEQHARDKEGLRRLRELDARLGEYLEDMQKLNALRRNSSGRGQDYGAASCRTGRETLGF
ncbi:hypothetical protein W97_01053 [Coniosporium apollinis CBS 100218]|uniref:Uncharacterized protein n=1 Tax=Coniosporium apollinis (strain CBS 100218) TaxID=1168221 RepID=R7YIU7_CONA1|nr:uncharacterized protein W97_01053 [Coniosporium apollinis CBS 100218]EON61835.1 hypothetical protein W97_01053 [Coniosporium apollinis CBS 100218]